SGEGWDGGIKIKYFSLFLILLTPTLSSRRGSFLLNLTALPVDPRVWKKTAFNRELMESVPEKIGIIRLNEPPVTFGGLLFFSHPGIVYRH
ncbi:hypothetical protein, partial [Methylomicrobium sp. Wu6]|uniref:hypothetical protein n=1 Tax=Methylomicrobium sp. Wu6 TaxID=3107928 RepID=UPI002DD63DDD